MDPKAFENFQSKIRIGLPESKENDQEPQLKLKIKSDHLTYSSTVKSLNGNGVRYDPYFSTYIGIRNKEDGTMKLYEIEQATVGAKFKAPATKNPTLLQEEVDTKDEKKTREMAKKHLVQEFGQSKGKRIFAQADRMAIEAENLTEKLTRTAENVDQKNISMPNQSFEDVKLAPPCNRSATKVEDAYPISEILSQNDIKSLIESSESFDFTDSKLRLSEMFKKHMETEDLDKLAIAMYMEGIIHFLNMRAKEFSKGPRGLPEFLPMGLRQKIFNVFTDEQRISPESKDRAMCYILVLGLIINNFILDFSQITNSIKGIRVPQ